MKTSEIAEAVRAGKITLDPAGHSIWCDTKKFLIQYDEVFAIANGANDGKWSSIKDGTSTDVNETNTRMRKFYQNTLDTEVEQEGEFKHRPTSDGEYCVYCGERLHWVLTGDKLQLRNRWVADPTSKWGGDFINHPVDYVCKWGEKEPARGEIQIASRLIVANFFRGIPDSPKDKEFEWDLNCLAGRRKISAFKAKHHNVAYGQMSNMSIAVYVNKSKDSIIIGPCDRNKIQGHKNVGWICLDVWRWEVTDLNTVGGPEEYKELKKDHEYRKLIELDVPYGTWEFEHYFDMPEFDEEKEVYSKLVLKK